MFSAFPFVRYAIALIVGIVLYLYGGVYHWALWGIWGMGIVGFYVAYRQRIQLRNLPISGILGLFLLVLSGYLLTYLRTAHNNPTHFQYHLNGVTHYQATIETLVEERANSWKATATINQVVAATQTKACTGQVMLYFDKESVARPSYGDVFLIKDVPRPIEGPKNPEEFDYRQYLANQGIYFQQYLREESCQKIAHTVPNAVFGLAYRVNTYADSLLTTHLGSRQEYGVANAMILGLRDDLDSDLMQAYSAAGAIHVLSVSGLHVGVIYKVLAWLLLWLQRKNNKGKWASTLIILGVLWFYAFVTGLSSPVLRSTFMFSLMLLAETINRKHNAYNTVAFSAFWLLIFNPYFVVNVGFQLSYLAVFGMIHIQPYLNPIIRLDKRKNIIYWLLDRLWKVTTVAVAAQIATFPITIYYFHQFPNWFLLANPVVILLSSGVLIYGLAWLLLMPIFTAFHFDCLIHWSSKGLDCLIIWLNKSVIFTEQLPYAITRWLHLQLWEVWVMYGLIFCVLAVWQSRRFVWVKAGAVCLTTLFMSLLVEKVQVRKQQKLVVHAIPKHTALSMIEGKKAYLYADADLLNSRKDIRYRFTNFWAANNTVDTLNIILSKSADYQVFTWNNKTFLLLKSPLKNSLRNQEIQLPNTHPIDYLWVANKAIRHIDEAQGIAFKNLLIDPTNPNYLAQNLAKEAQSKGVKVRILKEEGALVLE